jgi:hypothetical protein
MSRQRTPGEDFDAKQQLLTYCEENEIVHPFQDLPFEWVQAISVPDSPPPSLTDALSMTQLRFDDQPFNGESRPEDYLTQALTLGKGGDILELRTWPSTDLEFLTPFQHGEDAFRRYGPINLKKCALFVPKETLKGERGMEISNDRSELDQAIIKDSRLAATQEDAGFLKSIVSEHVKPTPPDIVLPKVLQKLN